MKRTLLIFAVTLCVLTACRTDRDRLMEINSLLNDNRLDTAQICLNRISPSDLSVHDEALYNLITVKLNHLSYRPFTSDTLIRSCINVFTKYDDKERLAESFYYKAVADYEDGRVAQAFTEMKKAEAEKIAREALKKVGMLEKADAYPISLSGGQQQRVAIARGLATRPEIIYFDEPTSALDPELIGEVLAVMRQLAGEGMTMLVVTHEMEFARNVSNKIIFMDGGQVIETGPTAEFFSNPKEERSRSFIRSILNKE